MKVILDEIILSGTFNGFKPGDSLIDFKRLCPEAVLGLEHKKQRSRIFLSEPVQFGFTGDTMVYITLKCYYRSMKFFFEGKPIKILHSIAALKKLLESKNISFVENRTISEAQINLEVNQCVTFIYSVEDNGDLELAQISSPIAGTREQKYYPPQYLPHTV